MVERCPTETVDTGPISGRVKPKTTEISSLNILALRSAIERVIVTPSQCVVDLTAGGSFWLQDRKAFANSWLKQFEKLRFFDWSIFIIYSRGGDGGSFILDKSSSAA